MSSPGGAPPADQSVVLAYAESPIEADTIVALLEANGVHAYAAHRRLEDVFPALFSHDGTAVIVLAGDLELAKGILTAEVDEADSEGVGTGADEETSG